MISKIEIGFTGTSKGITREQYVTVDRLFFSCVPDVLHHGDCIGGDEQIHKLALEHGLQIEIHPPLDPKKRAWCTGHTKLWSPKPYIVRNHDIVDCAVNGVIAAPRTKNEQFRGSGTWATIRYARKKKRNLWIVWPDGTYSEELR